MINIPNEKILANNKKFNIRVVGNDKSDYIYILNHGLLSVKESFRPIEAWGDKKYLFISFDARGNQGSKLKPSRRRRVYEQDLRDLVLWVKDKYPNKKIIVLGSSWGACVVTRFTAKYSDLVDYSVAWSIPHTLFSSEDAIKVVKQKDLPSIPKHSEYRETTIFGMAWRFFVTIFFNITTKIKLKLNEDGTTNNKTIKRVIKMKRPDRASTKYLWASFKAIKSSIHSLKKVNQKPGAKMLYIQSVLDGYGKEKTFTKIQKITGKNVKYLELDEFGHALHWELKCGLNTRVFESVENWIKTGIVNLPRIKKFEVITNCKPTISFIVAAYNVKNYIEKCIKSLLEQNDKDFEIIIIDDKSTDGTSDLLHEHFGNNKRVKIITNKRNMGLSYTRNAGVKNANGEWFVFIDGDDFISSNFVENMKPHLEKDFNFYIYKIKKDERATREDLKVQKRKMDDSIVSRVIHHSIFDEYKFPYKYHYAIEDWDFYVNNFEYLKIKNLSKIKSLYYHYTYNPNSLSKSKKVYRSRVEHAISIYKDLYTRRIALDYGIYGHYYYHLFIMAKIWFPDLLKEVIKIKYKTPTSLALKIQYFFVKKGVFKKIIRKQREAINE